MRLDSIGSGTQAREYSHGFPKQGRRIHTKALDHGLWSHLNGLRETPLAALSCEPYGNPLSRGDPRAWSRCLSAGETRAYNIQLKTLLLCRFNRATN